MATSQVKISSFYGTGGIARPYMVLDKNGEAVKDRVEQPSANGGLLAWAAKAPVTSIGVDVSTPRKVKHRAVCLDAVPD